MSLGQHLGYDGPLISLKASLKSIAAVLECITSDKLSPQKTMHQSKRWKARKISIQYSKLHLPCLCFSLALRCDEGDMWRLPCITTPELGTSRHVLLLLEMQCVLSFCLCSSRPLAVAEGFLPPTHVERWGPVYTVWGVTIAWGSCSSPGTRGTWATINTVFTGRSIFTVLPNARAASHTWERDKGLGRWRKQVLNNIHSCQCVTDWVRTQVSWATQDCVSLLR